MPGSTRNGFTTTARVLSSASPSFPMRSGLSSNATSSPSRRGCRRLRVPPRYSLTSRRTTMAWPSPRRTSPRALTSSAQGFPRLDGAVQGTRAAVRPLPRPPHEGDGALREEEAGGGDGRVALRGVLH
ncbi:hypothetical protein HMPREF6745_1718 [Prevotella sp. oral taxon 472 str. F0295]|nr:hypothetical protein HMPREF6745_1718 [Prevotella sp. oral taxon 472 str. F0295]